ncbi:class I SAM-dependent methyltransferase [Microvirga massiliensis]|uniref:class I SAM-dependent methyltransferase n=1 Tax=Microvirga massiliensis TaxID=1033741 RepID=UPI00065FF476|nr:class I SAM-dependent methyltransferase [Microvirga massiliensis]
MRNNDSGADGACHASVAHFPHHSSSIDVGSRYEFGLNWSAFASTIDERAIDEAEAGLRRLFPNDEIAGRRFLDIGCGSGLHALAALRLGADEVTAIDIDPHSAETTRRVFSQFAPNGRWTVRVGSVLELAEDPSYDIVYAWGVLHHTGAMHRAIERAAEQVAPGGLLCLALYRKTPFCRLWKHEKRLYTAAPRPVRRMIERLYLAGLSLALRRRGGSLEQYRESYEQHRGMEFMTDVRDWLGGYPYESISEANMLAFGRRLDLITVRTFCEQQGSGLFGSGCNEYVFRRPKR